jgi:hypothetical protein
MMASLPVHCPLRDVHVGFQHPIPQTITVKIATTMFTETVEKIKHCVAYSRK